MDWEYALYQMACLAAFAPGKVYRTTRYHRQTKKQWSRDDPAFLVIFVLALFSACVLIGLVYSGWSLGIALRLALSVVLLWLGVGSVLLSTFMFLFANRFLIDPTAMYSLDSWADPECARVEWLYAFDVHCNALFGGVFLPLVVVQGALYAFLIRNRLSSCMLHVWGLTYYWYITWLGYDILPFLRRTQVFLLPIPLLGMVALVATAFGQINLTEWTWNWFLP